MNKRTIILLKGHQVNNVTKVLHLNYIRGEATTLWVLDGIKITEQGKMTDEINYVFTNVAKDITKNPKISCFSNPILVFFFITTYSINQIFTVLQSFHLCERK